MNINNENDRFNVGYDELSFEPKNSQITVTEEISVGDIVILKGNPNEIMIKSLDFTYKGVKMADFAGVFISNGLDNELRLFNRKDILKKVTK